MTTQRDRKDWHREATAALRRELEEFADEGLSERVESALRIIGAIARVRHGLPQRCTCHHDKDGGES
jgi:hypothetical protein